MAASSVRTGSALAAVTPSLRLRLANFLVFQCAWFAAVLGAAHGMPLAGTMAVLAAIGWHIAVSLGPAREAMLVGLALSIGLVAETVQAALGLVRYPSGQFDPWMAPYWLVALWGLLAIALNVTMRWLRGRPLLAALVGAVAGPLSFVSGVRLGAARFVAEWPALLLLALIWALALPLLMWLAPRFDGVGFDGRAGVDAGAGVGVDVGVGGAGGARQ